jgi:hypothetical protein
MNPDRVRSLLAERPCLCIRVPDPIMSRFVFNKRRDR